MLIIGISWFVFWALINVFTLTIDKAALVTAIIFVLLGLLLDYGPDIRKRL